VRLFVAAWPPPEVLDAVEALDRPTLAGVRWTTRDQWHVTLRFLGQVDDVGAVARRLEEVGLDAGLVAVAGPLTTRLGRSFVVLPVSGLDRLAAAVVDLTASVGEPPDPRPFAGHLTLARAKPGVGVGDLVGAPLSAQWPISEVTLVASELHATGARYSIVARFSLS
jgi:RNA 2',3'-cyclic 3'-phosphodiesterase